MTPAAILKVMSELGFAVDLAADDRLRISPSSALSATQRELLLEHKAAIVQYLRETKALADELIAAAMRRCDRFGDGPEAREQMRQDCAGTLPHLRADLLEHFRREDA